MSPSAPFDLAPSARQPRAEDGGDEAPALRRRGATRLTPPEAEDAPELDPRRPVRVARAINALLVALALIGTVQVVGLAAVEVQRLLYSEAEIARLEAEIESLARETADLLAIAERSDDERYRELLARRQGYVYPWETRFIGPVGP